MSVTCLKMSLISYVSDIFEERHDVPFSLSFSRAKWSRTEAILCSQCCCKTICFILCSYQITQISEWNHFLPNSNVCNLGLNKPKMISFLTMQRKKFYFQYGASYIEKSIRTNSF